jgi:phospholipase/lecithinase/hemolysin
MNFRIDQWSAAALRRGLVAVSLVGSVLLGSCGGSVSSQEFAPKRMLVFGDEASVLTGGSPAPSRDAKKYTVNGLDGSSELDCRLNLLWVQWLASNPDYNFVFAQCNFNNAAVTAFNYATAGAKVADAVGQVNAWLNAGNSFGPTDLVTVMVGQNDIIEIYEAYKALPTDQQTLDAQNAAVTAALNRGKTLAALFTNVITNGSNSKARALYVVIPDVGKTPYGLSQPDGGTLLSRMTFGLKSYEGFNLGLRDNIANNGRSLGLVDGYNLFFNLTNNTDNFANNNGIFDLTGAGCLPANQPAYNPDASNAYCSSSTLVNNANGSAYYLWADQTHFGTQAHFLLGDRARFLVENNPF